MKKQNSQKNKRQDFSSKKNSKFNSNRATGSSDIIKKKENIWKTGTIVLGITCLILLAYFLIQIRIEEKKEDKRICSIIEGTPAWVNHQGLILKYGVLNSGYANNQTKINDTILTDYLIENRIRFVYNEECSYCKIQKQMLGEENFNRLKKNKLTLDCGVVK
jgi:hypothetical protein